MGVDGVHLSEVAATDSTEDHLCVVDPLQKGDPEAQEEDAVAPTALEAIAPANEMAIIQISQYFYNKLCNLHFLFQ